MVVDIKDIKKQNVKIKKIYSFHERSVLHEIFLKIASIDLHK